MLTDSSAPGLAARRAMDVRHGIRHVTLQPEAAVAQPLLRGSHPPVSRP